MARGVDLEDDGRRGVWNDVDGGQSGQVVGGVARSGSD